MSLVPVSDALKDLLDRKGMRGQTAGTVEACGMKGAGVSYGSDGPQVADEREDRRRGLVLVWTNPHMTKATGRRTSRAALVICE